MAKKKLRLGDLLVDHGLITEEELKASLAAQKISGLKLGEQLIEDNAITEEKILEVLEFQLGIPHINLNRFILDAKAPKLISESLASKHTVIPVAIKRGKLMVAMADPLDMIAIDDLRITTGMEVEVAISAKGDIIRAINRYYDASDAAEKAVEDFKAQHQIFQDEEELEDDDVTNAPMVRLVNTVISQAVKVKASDIHIEPFEKHVRIRYRVDGELREVMSPAKATHSALVTRIKIMGKMDISERRIPQDGRIETIIDNNFIDMRISVLPTVYGEKVVIRLLDRSGIVVDKRELGFTEYNLERFDKIIKSPEGLILVTGPTGSGKTTTLYAVLKELNQIEKNIITVEDPVEYRLDGVNQVQVNTKAGLTFASGLRSILRQDPDIVMVGEIRDTETAEIAIRAAITGHVVLSTVHTNDTASTVSRLVDMGIENYMVSSAVVGVVAQRLVKMVCPKCGEKHATTEEEMKILKIDKPVTVRRGKGCNACNQTGYLGRTAIHEIMHIDREIRSLVNRNAGVDELQDHAIKRGMKTLQESARDLVMKGVTTVEEMVKVTYQMEG